MKIHKRNHSEDPNSWTQSPHVEGAVRDGTFTVCGIIAEGCVTDGDDYTCKACDKPKYRGLWSVNHE